MCTKRLVVCCSRDRRLPLLWVVHGFRSRLASATKWRQYVLEKTSMVHRGRQARQGSGAESLHRRPRLDQGHAKVCLRAHVAEDGRVGNRTRPRDALERERGQPSLARAITPYSLPTSCCHTPSQRLVIHKSATAASLPPVKTCVREHTIVGGSTPLLPSQYGYEAVGSGRCLPPLKIGTSVVPVIVRAFFFFRTFDQCHDRRGLF